jgi:AraC-like DNA-binding protein
MVMRLTSALQRTPQFQLEGLDLTSLRGIFDHVNYGIVLLDRDLRSRFINRAFRNIWHVPNEKADNRPNFAEMVQHGRDTKAYEVPNSQMDSYVSRRIALVRSGNVPTLDLRLTGGKIIRLQCKPLADGARLLTYFDVTDLALDRARTSSLLIPPAQALPNLADSSNDRAIFESRRAAGVPWQARRTEKYIDANWERPLNMEAIAASVGASARSIFRAFQQTRGYSPKAYAKQVRLRHARGMLESADARTTVTDVAFACGFRDLSHFSKDYRQSFGGLPSRVLDCARSG